VDQAAGDGGSQPELIHGLLMPGLLRKPYGIKQRAMGTAAGIDNSTATNSGVSCPAKSIRAFTPVFAGYGTQWSQTPAFIPQRQ
jgi:hypothetical protein